jgi:zinc transport system substrate-binding protein
MARSALLSLVAALAMLLTPTLSWAGIVVTLPPLGGLVRMLDDQAGITVLLPPTADPHHFQMSPKASESLQQATLFIRSSSVDGGWSGLESTATTLDLWPKLRHGWTRPDLVRAALPRLAEALEHVDPAHAASIRNRLPAAIAKTRRIEAEWRQALAPLRRGGVIMQHPSWQPLCELMGVPVLAVMESDRHGQEFGPRDLDRALQIVDAHPGVVLIAEARHDNRALDWIARHSRHPLRRITLDAIGTNTMSWDELMRADLARIRP